MQDSNIYGLPNRMTSQIMIALLEHEHLSKMLYYTGEKYTKNDILIEEPVSWVKLIGKNIFIGKRIPLTMNDSQAYMAFRVYNYKPTGKTAKNSIYEIIVDIDIIVHEGCQKTIHGTRDGCMLAMVHEALTSSILEDAIGEIDIQGSYDLRDIPADYSGYTCRIIAQTHKLSNNYSRGAKC